jgi:hypothetical protein
MTFCHEEKKKEKSEKEQRVEGFCSGHLVVVVVAIF